MQCTPSFLTKVRVKLFGDKWKVLNCRNIAVLPFYHCQVLLGCYSYLLLLDWLGRRQGLQFLDKPGQNPTLIKVGRRIRSRLNQSFSHNRLVSISIAHSRMKQDEVPVMQNRQPCSSPNQAIKKAITIAHTSIKPQVGNSGLSYAPFFKIKT
jgi:hypothetical protein